MCSIIATSIYHVAEEENRSKTFSIHAFEIVAQMRLCHRINSDEFCMFESKIL